MRENKSIASDKLGISVVICTYNGSSRLLSTLNSVIQQDLANTLFELIVIDNASQDNTLEFCERVLSEAQVTFQWEVVSEQKPGLNYARLKGLREAHFEVVLFCDDDNELAKNYLRIAIDLLESNPRVGALGGCGIPSFERAKPDWFDRYSHSFAVGPQAVKDGRLTTIPAELYGAGTFFRKAPLLHFFDQGFTTVMSDRKGETLASGGDVEWCYLIQLAGHEIWYDHRLTFVHTMSEGRLTWSYYLRLKEAISSGACRLLPYECLLKNHHISVLGFIWYWSSRTVLSTLVYLKHRIVHSIKYKRKDQETELALVILHGRVNSYWKDINLAVHHFNYLKSIL